jgi:hypothetical protein
LHYVKAKPGRYSVSVAVQFGSAQTYDYSAKQPHELRFAAGGEWTGTLSTGAVEVALFEKARE